MWLGMRTNIEIDDALMTEAMAASGLSTKRATVDAALRLLARRKRQAAVDKLFGKVDWQGWRIGHDCRLVAQRRNQRLPCCPAISASTGGYTCACCVGRHRRHAT
jgi:Arc/MetJ family transcription regulator